MKIYLDNRIVPEQDAVVSVLDHGLLYGDGIYETMRAYNGIVFMAKEHLLRFERSASLIQLKLPKTLARIEAAINETMDANALRNAYVRLSLTRGKGPIGLDPDLCKEPKMIIIATDFKDYPESFYSDGVKIMISSVRRNHRQALDPRIKSLNFLNNILAKIDSKNSDAYEALMLNTDGFLAEGTVSNIFFMSDNLLCTPSVDCGILDGITRRLVIDLAEQSGIKTKEGNFLPEDLLSADEAFITNTTMEVMPVSLVGEIKFRSGPVAKKLLKAYRNEVKNYINNRPGENISLWK
ncbi:MAG: aminotransferase class IV [Dissulfurispiraceae bacterium]|jgi:branched-chain amino acid aminotransferase|nr:aminotransferase class IV [Dissulfurispiraceae bacterium]